MFQLTGVNVREAGETVPSVVSVDENGIVTSAPGCDASENDRVTEPPPSQVVSGSVESDTRTPTDSLSVLLTETSATVRPE